MSPLIRSAIHALGFLALLIVLALVAAPIDLPIAKNGFLSGYGHQLLLDDYTFAAEGP